MELKKTENVSTSDDQLNQNLQKQISSIESKYEVLFSRLEQEKRSELEYLKRSFENRQQRLNLQKEVSQKNKNVPKSKPNV
jgi:hypothetical protein